MKDRYWDLRLEKWGAWRVGAGGAKVATWANLRPGSPLASWPAGDEAVPRLHIEERETHDLLAYVPAELRAFALAAYPAGRGLARRIGVHPDTVQSRYARLHRMLARLLDQRRRGEPLDATSKRPADRRQRRKVSGQQVASAAID